MEHHSFPRPCLVLLAFKLRLSLWQRYFLLNKKQQMWVLKGSLINQRYTGSLPSPLFLSQYLHLLKICQQWDSTHFVGYLVWKKERGCANTGCGWVPEGPARCRGEGDRGAVTRGAHHPSCLALGLTVGQAFHSSWPELVTSTS